MSTESKVHLNLDMDYWQICLENMVTNEAVNSPFTKIRMMTGSHISRTRTRYARMRTRIA